MSRRLLKSTAVTGGMTLISRIAGLARDISFAGFMGASAHIAADAFYVAFAIPNFFRRIFGEGAFSQAFVPVLSELKDREGEAAARRFVSRMSAAFAGILFLVTLAGVAAAPWLVMALAPGFLQDAAKFELTTLMLRLTFPYLLFISLVAMCQGILNSFGRFGAPAFTPVLLNLTLIGAVVWGAPLIEDPERQVLALAGGVFVAGVIQLLFQLPFLKGIHMLVWPRLKRDPAVSRVFRLMLPAIFGSSVAQINMLVNRLLASFLVTGSVSWLYYSDRLMEFPLGVFGIALATVILPSLSFKHANGSGAAFSRTLDWALRWVFLISIPATVGLVFLARPILITLFQYGAFGAHDVEMTARALMAFALGLTGFVLVKVLAPGFYARQDTKTPAKIAAVAFGVNIVLSLALVFPLKHVGLALAISLAAFLNAGLLFRLLRRDGVYTPRPGWAAFLARVALASAALGVLLYWGAGETADWLEAGILARVLRLSLWVLGGILCYIAMLWITGIRPRQLSAARSPGDGLQ